MKKIVILSLAVILGLSFVLVAPILAEDTNTDKPLLTANNSINNRDLVGDREKILTPAEICLFDKDSIVRHGNSLYGVRMATTSLNANTCPAANPILDKFNKLPEQARAAVRQLEKIAAPWLIHQYEQIRQVGTALWGLKKDTPNPTPNPTPTPTPNPTPTTTPLVQAYVTPEKAACVIAAIKVKDMDLKNSNASTTEALNAAISARTICQENAINLTASSTATSTATSALQLMQKNELMLCNQAFQEAFAKVKTDANTRHQLIWTTYRNSLTTCQPTSTSSPELIIEDGGGSLF